jgi:hypothetical protein
MTMSPNTNDIGIRVASIGAEGTIAFPSDGGRAHCIITFIYYEVHVPCETHHDDNSYHFLKPTVR